MSDIVNESMHPNVQEKNGGAQGFKLVKLSHKEEKAGMEQVK